MAREDALTGKVAVITGGNSGIGLATAHEFKKNGARLVIFGRSRKSLDQAAASLGGGAETVEGDVRNLGDLERLFKLTGEKFGKIDVLVANAGIAKFSPIDVFPEQLFDELCDTLFEGVFFTVQKALPHLREGASVILVSTSEVLKKPVSATLFIWRRKPRCAPWRSRCRWSFSNDGSASTLLAPG